MRKVKLMLATLLLLALSVNATAADFNVGYAVCHKPRYTRCEVPAPQFTERLLSWDDFVTYETGIDNPKVTGITYDDGVVVIYFTLDNGSTHE